MHILAELCVKRPVFATVLILILVVIGMFSYTKLGVDRFPKVDFPTITVTTRMPGSAPEEIETEITDKIEEAVNTVSGIDELRSVSSEGISQVFVTFLLEKDINVASQEVRDRINLIIPQLPQDIELPTVEKMDPDAAPIMAIALSGKGSIKELTEYADKVLRRRLESVQGVGQVMLIGGQLRQINIRLNPLKLRAYNLTVADVARALETQNLEVPGGSLKMGPENFTLRTLGRIRSLEGIQYLTIANRRGHLITVNDVGDVEDGVEDALSMAQLNETPAIILNIRKQSGSNTVEVVHNVKERLEVILESAPKGYQIETVRDQSVFIEMSANTVKEHLVLGSILAAIVVFFFLANIRTTLISALAIPTSIISAFGMMKYMDFTLNSITLLALALSVGIVIDDAIVVLENIFRYVEEKNYNPFEAAIAATKEIGLAVLSITLSLVAVFTPIAFMGGIVGRFLKSFGLTMSCSIVVSMLVSFTLTPMLAARILKKKNGNSHSSEDSGDLLVAKPRLRNGVPKPGFGNERNERKASGHSASKKQGFYHIIEVFYISILKAALRFRWAVVLLIIALLFSVPTLMKHVRKNFLPDDDQSEFQVNIRAPEGTSLEATHLIISRIAREIRQLNGVRYTVANAAETDQHIENTGSIYVRLSDVGRRTYNQLEMMNFIRKNLLPKYRAEKLRVSVSPIAAISGGGTSSASIQFMIGGPDLGKLEEYSRKIIEKLRQVPGAVDVDSTLVTGKPQFGIVTDRDKASDLGVSIADIAKTVRLLVAGDKVSDYNEKGEKYEIRVRARAQSRNSVAELSMMTVPSLTRGTIPIGDVVKFEKSTGPAQINRLNRNRQVTVTSNLAPNISQEGVIDALNRILADLNMEPEYKTGFLGQSKELGKAKKGFAFVFLMAFIFVYLVLAAQFESWLHPITILLSLPLTLPFALISLILFNQSLNVFSTLGVLVLFAVVKKNSILQVDHTNQLRAEGFSRYDAIVAANLDRLRPILMTTIAFVAGMIPLLLSSGAGAATNKTISSVIVGGQTLSLLLTLVATPVAYSLFDDLANAAYRLIKRSEVKGQG